MIIQETRSCVYGNGQRLVNLGCGDTFHPYWLNLDKYSLSSHVMAFDIGERLPFKDSSVHAVYTSHFIEHLPTERAEFLCKEIFRVLHFNSILRIVTPDLEEIVQIYMRKLHDALQSKTLAADEYNWIVLELFDQIARHERGGEMGDFLRRNDLEIRDFIRSRIGNEACEYWDAESIPIPLSRKIRSVGLSFLVQRARNLAAKVFVYLIAGKKAAKAFDVGLFRHSGEIHYRLYDRYSLGKLLAVAGFTDIKICRADESQIPDFNIYGLDVIDGVIRKPDSLFMEARKP